MITKYTNSGPIDLGSIEPAYSGDCHERPFEWGSQQPNPVLKAWPKPHKEALNPSYYPSFRAFGL